MIVPRLGRTVRRLLVLISALFFLEMLFMAGLSPLLPRLQQELGLSTSEAGVLHGDVRARRDGRRGAGGRDRRSAAARRRRRRSACSPSPPRALPSDWPAPIRRCWGRDSRRGSPAPPAGRPGMVWLLEVAPVERRGELLGLAFGVAEAGAIAGPLIGGLAAATGRAGAFAGVALLCVLLAAATMRFPAPPRVAGDGLELAAMFSSSRVRTAMWIATLPAILLAAGQRSRPAPAARRWGRAPARSPPPSRRGAGRDRDPAAVRPLVGPPGPAAADPAGAARQRPVRPALPWLDSRWAVALFDLLGAGPDRGAVGAADGDALRRLPGGGGRPDHGRRGDEPDLATRQHPRRRRRRRDRPGASQRWAYAIMGAALLGGFLALGRQREPAADGLYAAGTPMSTPPEPPTAAAPFFEDLGSARSSARRRR